MKTTILVDSEFGNTARLAEAVAQGLAPAVTSIIRIAAERPPWEAIPGSDLLVVGGPTMNRGMSPRLQGMCTDLEHSVRGLDVAVFDSRLRGPRLFTGSAAKQIERRLRAAGAHSIAPPESFCVHRTAPRSRDLTGPEDVTLVPGELERAREWGTALLDAISAKEVA